MGPISRFSIVLCVLFVLCPWSHVALGQTRLLPTQPVSREQLEQGLRIIIAKTKDSEDPEILAANAVLGIVLGSLLTGQSRPLLNYVGPFAQQQLNRLNKLRGPP